MTVTMNPLGNLGMLPGWHAGRIVLGYGCDLCHLIYALPFKLDGDAQCGSGPDDEVARGDHVAHVQALLQALGDVAEAARGWPDQR